jgi:hypothetical protein
MTFSKVTWYSLGFNTVDKQFYLYFGLDSDNYAHQLFLNAQEFTALSDMFRNEGPISYDTDKHYFVTDQEKVGEEEAQPEPGTDVLSTGTTVIKGTWAFDLDTGTVGTEAQQDVWWEQVDYVTRYLTGFSGALVSRLGTPDFNSVTLAMLKAATYTDRINGSNTSANQLTVGTVVGVRTNSGHYAKVLITAYGYNLGIRWVTYK